MRIGVLSDLGSANTIYRALPVVQLDRLGHATSLNRPDALIGCDVVHVYRFHADDTRRIAQQLRDRGTAIVWDIDDDLWSVPENVPRRQRKGSLHEQRMQRAVLAMAELADVVTTTSEPLAQAYRSRGLSCVRVVPNFLPDDFAVTGPRPHDGVVVGWIANTEHYHDLERLGLNATLRELLDVRPELRVVSVGVRFDLPAERYRHTPLIRPFELPAEIAGFDVGIAPLDDIPFNRARSDVKVKEYAAIGVPWLASPVGPYAGLGEKQGGRLVADDGWLEALDRLAGRARERRKLAKRAAKWGRDQTAAKNAAAWEAVMGEAVERARHRG